MAITSDKLVWVYTTYGLNRLTEAISNPSNKLFIYKIKIGDANGSYYEPSENITSLVNAIDEGVFYINLKQLSTDGSTVSFKTTIPENYSGFEIREIGLYETINEVDYLFAIGTCQPLVKPSLSDNYIISIDYKLNFKSQNLATVYEQIVINPDYEYLIQDDFDNLQSNILYIEGNLSTQISNDSHIIGLNRAAQLQEKVEQDFKYYTNIASTLNFTNLLNFTNIYNIKSYWVFNYSSYLSQNNCIVDYSKNSLNLNLNKNINLFERSFIGLSPSLDISTNNYFFINSDINFNLLNTYNNSDTPFSIIFLLKNNNLDTNNTLIAKSNYSSHAHSFEINKLADNSIELKLFSDINNSISFKSEPSTVPEDTYFLCIKYNGNISSPIVDIYINHTKVKVSFTSLGTYSGMSNISEKLTSYSTASSGLPQNYANSKFSIISLIKDEISEAEIKSIGLNMLALIGKDTCLVV